VFCFGLLYLSGCLLLVWAVWLSVYQAVGVVCLCCFICPVRPYFIRLHPFVCPLRCYGFIEPYLGFIWAVLLLAGLAHEAIQAV